MRTVREEQELAVDISSQSGQMAKLLTELLEQGVSVLTSLQFGADHCLKALLITDKPDQSETVLKSAGYRCRREDVLLVSVALNEPCAAVRIVRPLHEAGVKIIRSYVSQASSGDEAYVVLQTTNNREALRLLSIANDPPRAYLSASSSVKLSQWGIGLDAEYSCLQKDKNPIAETGKSTVLIHERVDGDPCPTMIS